MSLYSKNDLRDAALEELQVKDAGTPVSAEDDAIVLRDIQNLFEQLEDENLVVFSTAVSNSTRNIPGRLFQALTGLVAVMIGPKYGRAFQPVPRAGGGVETAYDVAMRRLRRSVNTATDDTPVTAHYY